MDKHVKEILVFIGRNKKGVSFYQLVRGFGLPDAPYDLQAVLHFFIEENFAELDHPEAGVNMRYIITEKGIETIGIG